MESLISEYKTLLTRTPPQLHIPSATIKGTPLYRTQAAALHTQATTSVPLDQNPAPWRITFDTNPDDCNLSCIMCEEHSIYSKSQEERKAGT